MPALRIACALPEGMVLPAGEYPQDGHASLRLDSTTGGSSDKRPLYWDTLTGEQWDQMTELQWDAMQLSPPLVSMVVGAEDGWDKERRDAFTFKSAQQLLYRLNLLIRWFRSETQAMTIREQTLAQAGPFRVFQEPSGELWSQFTASPYVVPGMADASAKDAVQRVREGFASKKEPPIEVLLLLDARHALSEGRFREAVLFCWGVIDGTFNQKFESLVKLRLAEEWKESREFLTGSDFGLRHKMGLGMRLVAGRSLIKEPDDFWSKLDRSYKTRNKIIHEGAIASEDDAQLSIWVAQRVVEVMKAL